MKKSIYILLVLLPIIFNSCIDEIAIDKKQIKPEIKLPAKDSFSLTYVDSCQNKFYKVSLFKLHKDSLFLKVKYHKENEKILKLNDVPNWTNLRWCTKDYIAVGFHCGGPCYARKFYFLNTDRLAETYTYCQKSNENHNIIIYIENEIFETLSIRNLKNGKSMKVDISICDDIKDLPCQYKKPTVKGNQLILYYDETTHYKRKLTINIEKIL